MNAARLRIEKAVLGNFTARAAVENALWDGLGKRRDVPVAAFFGGAVQTLMEVAWTLASGNSDTDIAEAQEMLAIRRHRQFKLKVGKRLVRDDIAHVSRIKSALGAAATITVDVNQAWDMHAARCGMTGLQEIGVAMVEQPVPGHLRAELAQLAAASGIDVMADEGLHGPADALAHARDRAADAFAVKIAQSGGLTRAQEDIAIGQAAGLGLYGGTTLEPGVGTAAALQLFATVETLRWGTELFGPLLFTDDILTAPLRYGDFQMHRPDGPACGVTLDADKVAHYGRGAARPMAVTAAARKRHLSFDRGASQGGWIYSAAATMSALVAGTAACVFRTKSKFTFSTVSLAFSKWPTRLSLTAKTPSSSSQSQEPSWI